MKLLIRLLVLLGSHPQVRVHQGDFIMFSPMAQDLLNIKLFCQRKFSKLFLKFNENCNKLLILLESFRWMRFLGDDLIIVRPNLGDILNFK
jgi:hypothetical protein